MGFTGTAKNLNLDLKNYYYTRTHTHTHAVYIDNDENIRWFFSNSVREIAQYSAETYISF